MLEVLGVLLGTLIRSLLGTTSRPCLGEVLNSMLSSWQHCALLFLLYAHVVVQGGVLAVAPTIG
jgi:hypothetical protein